jgi:hypothetical protein
LRNIEQLIGQSKGDPMEILFKAMKFPRAVSPITGHELWNVVGQFKRTSDECRPPGERCSQARGNGELLTVPVVHGKGHLLTSKKWEVKKTSAKTSYGTSL